MDYLYGKKIKNKRGIYIYILCLFFNIVGKFDLEKKEVKGFKIIFLRSKINEKGFKIIFSKSKINDRGFKIIFFKSKSIDKIGEGRIFFRDRSVSSKD